MVGIIVSAILRMESPDLMYNTHVTNLGVVLIMIVGLSWDTARHPHNC